MHIHPFVLLFMLFFSKVDGSASQAQVPPDQYHMRRTSVGGAWAPTQHTVEFDSLKQYDSPKIFGTKWFNNPNIVRIFKANISKMKIKTEGGKGQDLETTDFAEKWIAVAGKTILPNEAKKNPGLIKKKSQQFLQLLYDFGLEHAVRPKNTGKECLWSGHVENSNYARRVDGMTPLETPPLMEILSATFGTEHFPKGTKDDGFVARWLPNICPMFNAATVIYSSLMEPTHFGNGVVPVYVNQIKEWSAFFDSEIPLFLQRGKVQKIKFIILSPPRQVRKIHEITVNVVPNNAKGTQDNVMRAFQTLDNKFVNQLWLNQFDVAVNNNRKLCGADESHPFDDASAGTRKEGPKAGCIYKNFFENRKKGKPKRVSASLTSDRFELQAFIASLLLFFVLLLSFYKYVLPPKKELNVIFNTEPASHYTEFAQI